MPRTPGRQDIQCMYDDHGSSLCRNVSAREKAIHVHLLVFNISALSGTGRLKLSVAELLLVRCTIQSREVEGTFVMATYGNSSIYLACVIIRIIHVLVHVTSWL